MSAGRRRLALVLVLSAAALALVAGTGAGAPAEEAAKPLASPLPAPEAMWTHGRPAYIPAPSAIPPDAARARAILRHAASRFPAGSMERSDIAYVLRLADRHLRSGEPRGRRATVARTLRLNAWWYARRGAPAERVVVRDPDGILHTYWEGRGLAVNPVATTGRWQGLNAGLAAESLAEALLPLGVERRARGRAFTLWEYYDVPDRPGAILPGASGMAQGRMAQLLARAYYRTGDPRFADASRSALAAFTVPVDRGGVTTRVRRPLSGAPMPWYVERAYPGADPWRGAALNGFMVTLLNLDATADLLAARPKPLARGTAAERRRARAPGALAGAALARGLAERGERTLGRYLPAHDTGSWSLYGLSTPGYAWRGFAADLNYHCYHVALLIRLEATAPGRGFGATARRFAGYVDARGLRCPRGDAPLGATGR